MKARDLRGRIILAARLHPGVAIGALDDLVGDELGVLLGDRIVEAAADQPLDREHGVVGIGHRLALGRLADQPLAVLGEGDDRRRRARAFRILDDLGLAALHDGDRAVGGAEIDADHSCHILPLGPSKSCIGPRPLSEAARGHFEGDIGGDFVATRSAAALSARGMKRLVPILAALLALAALRRSREPDSRDPRARRGPPAGRRRAGRPPAISSSRTIDGQGALLSVVSPRSRADRDARDDDRRRTIGVRCALSSAIAIDDGVHAFATAGGRHLMLFGLDPGSCGAGGNVRDCVSAFRGTASRTDGQRQNLRRPVTRDRCGRGEQSPCTPSGPAAATAACRPHRPSAIQPRHFLVELGQSSVSLKLWMKIARRQSLDADEARAFEPALRARDGRPRPSAGHRD